MAPRPTPNIVFDERRIRFRSMQKQLENNMRFKYHNTEPLDNGYRAIQAPKDITFDLSPSERAKHTDTSDLSRWRAKL